MRKSILTLTGYAKRFLRRGRLFHQLLQELRQNEKLSRSELIEYQNQKLQLTVRQAYKDTSFYRQLFEKLKLTPEDIQTVDDLQLLPILKKSDLRGNEKQFVSSNSVLKFKAYTSGTTGTPLNLFRDRFSINLENAAIWRQRNWAKVMLNDRIVKIRGDIITPIDNSKPPFWKYTSADKQLIMSSYHLSDEFIPYYLQKLRDFCPAAIEAYPSSVYRLARYMQVHQETPILVKAVFTSSEMLFDYQRELIEKYFGRVFDYYGNAERVAYIAMCEFGNYHCASDYSVVEFLPTQDPDLYQIVGTTLHNAAMPLIRYATGDLARLSHQSCPCGRAFPLIKNIEGRQDDYVITPSGKWIGRLDLVFKGVSELVEGQIIQEEIDLVRVLIVPTNNFTQDNENILLDKLRERLGKEIKIVVQKVDFISRTKQGKFKLVVSKVRA